MPTILISGAASGLGNAFLQAYATDADNKIIAIDLRPINPSIVKSVHAAVETHQVDVTSNTSLNRFLGSLSNTSIDLVIHCVGVRGLVPSIETQYPNHVARAETLEAMDMDTMLQAFQINAAGTFALMRGLMDNLQQASNSEKPAKVVIMGSRMGSMTANTTGAAYAYRASKAALNAIVKSFSIDIPDVVFTIFHPGRVETGLVKCREEGAIEADESVKSMLPLISQLGLKNSGTFLDRFGEKIEW